MDLGPKPAAGANWCPSRVGGGACVEFGVSLWSNPSLEVFIQEPLRGVMLQDLGCLVSAAPSSLFQLCCSLTVADILSTSKRPFTLNYGCIKQQRAFNWVAIQKAGASSRGLSYQIHQGISTSCILNSLILKNKVIFSALEADICLQGLSMFL